MVAGGVYGVQNAVLPEELRSVAQWLVKHFTGTARKNRHSIPDPKKCPEFKGFMRHIHPELLELSKERRDDVAALLRFLRHSEQMKPKRFAGQQPDINDMGPLYPQLAQLVKAAETTGNGNCLWNSVSISLCGSEALHRLLRGVTTYVMVGWAELFQAMAVTHGGDDEDYLVDVFVSFTLREWGDTEQQMALSLAVGRDLFVLANARQKRFERVRGKPRWAGHWNPIGQLRQLDQLSLQELRKAYHDREEGLAKSNLVAGASAVLNRAGLSREEVLARREPLLTHFNVNHYTALLPLPTANLNLFPRPFDLNANYQGSEFIDQITLCLVSMRNRSNTICWVAATPK